jgi:hypothetical protein
VIQQPKLNSRCRTDNCHLRQVEGKVGRIYPCKEHLRPRFCLPFSSENKLEQVLLPLALVTQFLPECPTRSAWAWLASEIQAGFLRVVSDLRVGHAPQGPRFPGNRRQGARDFVRGALRIGMLSFGRPRSMMRCSPSASRPLGWSLCKARRSKPRGRHRSSFCAASSADFIV